MSVWRAALVGLAFALAAAVQPPGIEITAQRARQAMDAGQYDRAAALYRELVRALPDNAGMRMNLGLALHQSGRYREAIANFRLALKRQPELMPAWLMMGMAYLKLGQPALAIDPLERFLKASPENSGIRFELASAYLEAGQPGKALPVFQDLARAHPDNPKAWQGIALSYIALSQGSFHELEAVAPQSAYREFLLARSALDRGQSRSAMRLYRDTLAKMSALRGAHAGLAEAYRKTGHSDWAGAEDERERKLPPPDCGTQKLECEFVAGRYERLLSLAGGARTPEGLYWRSRACSALADAALARLSAMPPSSAIHELLAEAARLRGDLDGAAREWGEALKLAPGDRRLEKGLARVFWLKRDPRAVSLLEKLARIEPESAELNFELGDALVDEHAARAVGFLEKALKLAPSHLGAQAALGRAYVRLEEPALAIPHLRAALPLDEDGKLHYQLARAYQQTGQREPARQMIQKYRELARAARERRPAMDEDLKGPDGRE